MASLRALSLTDWYYVLGIAALLCTAVLFLYRKAMSPMFDYVKKKIRRVTMALDSVEAIHKEVFANGGGSLRDSVDRTAVMVERVAKHVSMSIAQNRSLFEQTDVGMFEGDEEGEVVWANRALRQMSGMRAEQITGSGWINAVHDDDRRRVENDWRLASAQQRAFISMFRLTHVGTGLTISVQCEAYPVFADEGDGAGWLGLIRKRELDA